jgi:hypothetical protein
MPESVDHGITLIKGGVVPESPIDVRLGSRWSNNAVKYAIIRIAGAFILLHRRE